MFHYAASCVLDTVRHALEDVLIKNKNVGSIGIEANRTNSEVLVDARPPSPLLQTQVPWRLSVGTDGEVTSHCNLDTVWPLYVCLTPLS
jgi:hypothetical protein